MASPRIIPASDLGAAKDKQVPDIIGHGLSVLFCGINPGVYSAATGYHFARPGNRFWPALYAGGFTPRVFKPQEQAQLLPLGYGITNVIQRSSVSAAELGQEELRQGGDTLCTKVLEYQPAWLAVLGIGVYRQAFGVKSASVGPQDVHIGNTAVWLLPNPSGLNAHYTPAQFGEAFKELRLAAEKSKA